MKYKLLLSLLVVSVLACGVAVAEDNKPKVVEADLDALERQLQGKTPKQVVEIIGGPPTKVTGKERQYWHYHWTFFDTVTQQTFKKMRIYFYEKKASSFEWGE